MTKKKTISPNMTRPARHVYRDAVIWIAQNDNAGNPDAHDVDEVHGMISVGLVSDLFEVDQRIVATDVVRARVEGWE